MSRKRKEILKRLSGAFDGAEVDELFREYVLKYLPAKYQNKLIEILANEEIGESGVYSDEEYEEIIREAREYLEK
ncbi:hypothetical protein [Halalkalibacter oceani]|uniref:hypothetical protein n=1 Tax=Halalkalibacter oceani TaxID=1653776 RepID=UPI0033958DF4